MELRKKLIRPLASRFFAGETLEDGISRTKAVNAVGMGVTLDFLGEDVVDLSEAKKAKGEYGRILAAIPENGLDCSLAVKLTHLGLDADRGLAFSSLRELGGLARANGIRLWLDMEGSAHTDDVIEAYRMLVREQPDSGLALQASLWRTWDDLKTLSAEGALIRLVKGAYREPANVAEHRPLEITRRYIEMMEHLFAGRAPFAVATHDKQIIGIALRIIKDFRVEPEFQMLMGMRDRLKRELVESGQRVVEYVPYGADWYGYGIRRLKEKRRNVLRMAEGLIGR
jgi:proline dehydrogenase